MARRALVTTIDLSGPFFQRDPAKTFRANARALLEELAEQGESDVRAQLASGNRAPISAGVQPDRVAGHVQGRVRALTGKPWALTAVVSVQGKSLPKVQAVALMAAASRVEGQTGAFKRTTRRMRSASKINAAELLKGIA